MTDRVDELKLKLANTRAFLESERRGLPYADGPAYFQSVSRINRLRQEKQQLLREIAEAEKGGEE